jgi:hypothetical protein
MIDITTQVTGGQIASALSENEEECARCIGELAEYFDSPGRMAELARNIAYYAEDADIVTAWLLRLASEIETARA